MTRIRDAWAVLCGRAFVIPPHPPEDEFDEFDTPPEEIDRMLREGEPVSLGGPHPYMKVRHNSLFGGGSYELYDGPTWTTTYGKHSPDNPAA